jgi:enoyl-CoA hydratase
MGLVNRVVPHDKLMDTAMALAKQIAAKPPQGVRMTKRALARARMRDYHMEDDYHFALHGYLVGSEDFLEADRAFVDKRKPTFKGG